MRKNQECGVKVLKIKCYCSINMFLRVLSIFKQHEQLKQFSFILVLYLTDVWTLYSRDNHVCQRVILHYSINTKLDLTVV